MWILAEPGQAFLAPNGRAVTGDIEIAARGGAPLAIVTRLRREGRGMAFAGRGVVDAAGRLGGSLGEAALDAMAPAAAVAQMRHGTARVIAVDEETDLLIEPVVGRPRVIVAGGGHVARAIARQAQLLDFDVTILEDRPEFADPDRFPGATVLGGDVPRTIASLEYGWNHFLVIATRGHKLDADCVRAAVDTPVGYIGLLGSRRKTVLVGQMLREAGVDEARIQDIRSPVGLDLGGRTPAEIALSVLAEITAERYQGTGRPLGRSATGPGQKSLP
ncbi:MAG: XdhC family protein [Vicinamibacterales bacterium]